MYATYESNGRRATTRRTWLAAGGALVALLVVLLLVMAACNARSGRTDPLAGGDGLATPGAGVGAQQPAAGTGGEDPGQTDPGGDGGQQPPGENPDPEPPGQPEQDPEPEPDPEPMSIEVSVAGPPPTKTCHATGKITIVGGDSQVNVTYRWYRLDLPPHPNPALPPAPLPQVLEEKTLPIPPASEIIVKSPDFPEGDAYNLVWLVVTIPDQVASQQVKYGECAELGISP